MANNRVKYDFLLKQFYGNLLFEQATSDFFYLEMWIVGKIEPIILFHHFFILLLGPGRKTEILFFYFCTAVLYLKEKNV